MKKHVFLVDLPFLRMKDPKVSLGHNLLLQSLKRDTYLEVTSIIIDINRKKQDINMEIELLSQKVLEISQNRICYVAIGVYIWADQVAKEIITQLRENGFEGNIILGGPQISYTDENLDDLYPEASIFIRGYAEDALPFAITFPGKPLAGIQYRGDLNSYEIALINEKEIPILSKDDLMFSQNFMRWECGRGCIFKCNFCQHRNPGKQPNVQYFSWSKLKEEIYNICHSSVKDVAILDPIFNTNQKHAERILQEFIFYQYTGKLSIQVRAELITDDFLNLVEKLNIHLEFGLQTIHQKEMKAINRINNIECFKYVITDVIKRGISFEVSIIYGLPQQTLKSFEQTINWCRNIGIKNLKAFPLLLLRGTDLYHNRNKYGFKIENETSLKVVESDTFFREEWEKMKILAEML